MHFKITTFGGVETIETPKAIIHNLYYSRVKKDITKSRGLKFSPQVRGTIKRVYTTNPRKPNSANRKVAKVETPSGRNLLGAIKGVPHSLKKFSKVILSGGGFPDTPGVNSKLVIGKENFIVNFYPRYRRSVYGVKKKSFVLFLYTYVSIFLFFFCFFLRSLLLL